MRKPTARQRRVIDHLRATKGAYVRRYFDGERIRQWIGVVGQGERPWMLHLMTVRGLIKRGILSRVVDETPSEMVGESGRFVLTPQWEKEDPAPQRRKRKRADVAEGAVPEAQ